MSREIGRTFLLKVCLWFTSDFRRTLSVRLRLFSGCQPNLNCNLITPLQTKMNHNHNNHNDHNDHNNHKYNGTKTNYYSFIPLPSKLLSHQQKIQKYNAKLKSIENNTCKELNEQIQRIEEEKQSQLQLLKQFESDDINDINDLYQPQIQSIKLQQKQTSNSFNDFCQKEIERTKQQIQSYLCTYHNPFEL